MSDPTVEPYGVIAIVTDEDGYVIATGVDFEMSGPGGYEPWRAQKYRAGKSAIFETIRAYCSPRFTSIIDDYLAERICEALLSKEKGKHRITYRAIGWSDDVRERIEE